MRDERSYVPITINAGVYHQTSELDVLVVAFEYLKTASKSSKAGFSTKESFHVIGIFPRQ